MKNALIFYIEAMFLSPIDWRCHDLVDDLLPWLPGLLLSFSGGAELSGTSSTASNGVAIFVRLLFL